jgi:hypothetical protein
MKTSLKIIGIIFALIIVALIAIPYLFSDKIEEIVKREINNYVDAVVDYDKFSLSIFSSFPDLQAGLEGVSVVGKERFANDTLAYIGRFAADVDIMSVFGESIAINKVLLESAKVKALVASDSTANWDIVKATPEDTTIVEEVDTTASTLALDIEDVSIIDLNVAYIDSTSDMAAYINGIDLDLSGKMVGDVTDIKMLLKIAGIDVEMGGLKMLNGSTVNFDAGIEADLANNKYTFKENELNFSGIPLAFDGYAQLKDSSTLVDIKLAAKETSFKTILTLIPDYIMKDVPGLKMDGTLDLFANVNGEYIDMDHIPALDIAFRINDGVVKYPNLPKSLNDINVDLSIKNPGGSADLTVVDLSKFHFELGSNPFDATLNVATPLSNATIAAMLKGVIELGSLKDALPLDSMTIDGVVNANLNLATDMKAIEAAAYETIKANGTLGLKTFSFESTNFPQGVIIPEAQLAFSPKAIELNPLKVNVGKSDFDVTGKVKNYLTYALSDGTLKGKVTLASKLIDCNELMGETTATTDSTATEEVATTDSTATTSAADLAIPKNLDILVTADIDKLLFDKLNIDNITGQIDIREGVAQLSKLKMNIFEGSASLNGAYNTKTPEKPIVDMAIDLSSVNINSLTNSFSTIDSMLPIAKSAYGIIDLALNVDTQLDGELSPVLETTNGKGTFRSTDIQLKGSEFQEKLSKLLNKENLKELSLKDLSVNFTIEKGNIIVEPFKMKILGKEAQFSGKQSLDQSMNYLLSIPFTRAEVISILGNAGAGINAEGADVPVGVTIKGKLTKPELGLNLDEAKSALINEVKAKTEEKINKAKEEIKAKAEEKIKEELQNNENVKETTDKLKKLFKR